MKQLFTLVLLSLFSSLYAVEMNIAVNDFEGKGLSQQESEVITEKIRTLLAKSPLFTVMSRGEMKAILEEQEFQQSGMCSEASCIAEVGQMIGVDRIVGGTIGKVGTMFSISMKMIDVRTSEILYSVTEECTCTKEEVLSTYSGKLVANMEKEVKRKSYAKLLLTSFPTGMDALINDTTQVQTPAYLSGLFPGSYTIKITGPTYKDTTVATILKAGAIDTLNVAMTHTLVFKDSVRTTTKRKRIGARIASTLVIGALAGTGAFFNSKIDKAITERDKLQNDYTNSDDPAFMANVHLESKNIDSDIETYSLIRTLSYGAAAAGATIFVISIPLKYGRDK